ncbi:MAG: ATP-binding protein [Chloroflexi bacterium]|nr:ATP-binding protein [Chloroflexota bacterium]
MGEDQGPRKKPMKELMDMRQQVAAYWPSVAGNGMGEHHDDDGRLESLQSILRAVTDGTYEWDLATNWLDWDDRLHGLVGTSGDGFTHHISEFIERIHPDDIGRVSFALDAHLQLNEPYRAEFRLRLASGDFSWASVVGEAVRDADGSPAKLVGALTLINDAKLTASHLMESETRLRALFDGISDGLAVLTPAGQIVDANAQACEFLGYDLADLTEAGLLRILVPNQVVDGLSLLGRAAGNGRSNGRIGIRHGDDTVILADMDLVRLPDGTLMCSLRDASRADGFVEREVQDHVMEALSRFSRALAHELNNALTPVMGYAQLSERALAEDNEVRKYLHQINNAADRAAFLTAQLLAFAQRQVGNPDRVNPTEVVTSSEPLLRDALGDNVELILTCDDDVWMTRIDPGHIQQALVNMADNSRQAMPFGGTFTVEVGNAYLDADFAKTHPGIRHGDYVCVTVSDTGVGMTEDVLSRAFEPLFTTKEPGGGLGMGLSTAYGKVRQNGGHIEVSSRPREGATFRMYFPRAAEGEDGQ